MFNSTPLTKNPIYSDSKQVCTSSWTGPLTSTEHRQASKYHAHTWLEYVTCITNAVLIPQRPDKQISWTSWPQYFWMHHYLSSDVTKSSLHMEEGGRRETDGITLSSPRDDWNPFRACLSLSCPSIISFSSFPCLLSPPSPSVPPSPYQAGQALQSIGPLVNNRYIIY